MRRQNVIVIDHNIIVSMYLLRWMFYIYKVEELLCIKSTSRQQRNRHCIRFLLRIPRNRPLGRILIPGVIAPVHSSADHLATWQLADACCQRFRLCRQVIPRRRHHQHAVWESLRCCISRGDAGISRVHARGNVAFVEHPSQGWADRLSRGVGGNLSAGFRV